MIFEIVSKFQVASWVNYVFSFFNQSDQSVTSLQVLLAGRVQNVAIYGIGILSAEVC